MAHGMDLSKKVTVKMAPTSLSRAMEELSQITGLDLKCGTPIRDEMLTLYVRDWSTSEILKKIAETLNAEWAKEGENTLRLVREPSKARDELRASEAQRAELLRGVIAAATKDISREPLTQEQIQNASSELGRNIEQAQRGNGGGMREMGRRFAQTASNLPGTRTTMLATGEIDPALLASIRPNGRLVFSSAPTSMQRRLGPNGLRYAQQMVADQRLMSDMAAGGQLQGPMGRMGGMGGGMMMGGERGEAASGPTTYAMLVVRRNGDSDTFTLQFIAANAGGVNQASGFGFIGNVIDPPAPKFVLPDEQPIELRPESAAFAKLVAGANPAGPVQRLIQADGAGRVEFTSETESKNVAPADLRKYLAEPHLNEPLALFLGDSFKAVSKDGERPVIAAVPDQLMGLANQFTEGLTTKAFVQALQQQGAMNVLFQDGWIVMRPQDPAAARANHTDRQALAQVIKSFESKGYLSLDERASFALNAPLYPGRTDLDTLAFGALFPEFSRRDRESILGENREWLRLYGTLTSSQKQALQSEGGLPLNMLGEAQRNELNRIVFDDFAGPRRTSNQRGGGTEVQTTVVVAGGPPGGRGRGPGGFGGFNPNMSVGDERTVVLSSGIPSTARLRAQVEVQEALMGITAEGEKSFLNASELARNTVFSTNQDAAPEWARNTSRKFEKFRMARETEIELQLLLATDYQMNGDLEGFELVGSGMVTMSNLPASFNALYQEELKRWTERVANMRERGGPGGGMGRRRGGGGDVDNP